MPAKNNNFLIQVVTSVCGLLCYDGVHLFPVAGKYLREERIDFRLPYDIWFSHEHNQVRRVRTYECKNIQGTCACCCEIVWYSVGEASKWVYFHVSVETTQAAVTEIQKDSQQ